MRHRFADKSMSDREYIKQLEYMLEVQGHAIEAWKTSGELVIRTESSIPSNQLAVTTDTLTMEKQRSREDGWQDRDEWYRKYQQPVEQWLREFMSELNFLRGALAVSFGNAQLGAIKPIGDRISQLLHRIDVLNRIWDRDLNAIPIDVSPVMRLRDIIAEIESEDLNITDLIEFLKTNPFDDSLLMEDVIQDVTKLAPGRNEEETVTRTVRRAIELRPWDDAHKISWKSVFLQLRSEWRERIKSGICDEIDRKILQELDTCNDGEGTKLIKKRCFNRK